MELPDKNTDLSDSMEHSQLITTIYNSFNQLPVEDAILILDDIRRKLNCETSAWDVKMDVATFKGDSLENEDIILNSIKSECRKMQVTTTEELKVTKKKVPIVELDAFIYDDINDIETDNDKYLSIYYYCKSCSSRDIGFTKLVSHSMSAHRVKTLFRNYLPQVYSEEKGTLIDIGSRYGVVLYGAALYGLGFQQIIGIEIDEMFCNIQRKIVQEYGFDETIQIHHGDLLQCPSMISQAQVLILNNVFEYFCSASEQNKCWEFLKENCSVGCILVLVPSIQVIWKRLRQSGKKLFHWKQWVEECTVEHVDCAEDNQPETEDVHFYKVIPNMYNPVHTLTVLELV